MRICFKVLLFPVQAGLFLLMLPCKFLCYFTTMMLSILSFITFGVALLVKVMFGEMGEGVRLLFASYLVSPFGVPMIATLSIAIIDDICERIRVI